MMADPPMNRNSKTKIKLSYQMLPEFFTLNDIVEKFGCERSNAKIAEDYKLHCNLPFI